MENDIQVEYQQNIIESKEFFKLDFSKEKLKGNRKFEEFKNKKLDELGKDAKLFHCKIDNLFFYVSKKECKIFPFYFKQCPFCNNYVCYFCERNSKIPIEKNGKCCVLLRLYYLLFHLGFGDLKSEDDKDKDDEFGILRNILLFIMNFLPLFGPYTLLLITFDNLFFGLPLKDKI